MGLSPLAAWDYPLRIMTMKHQRFRPEYRLRRNADFQRAYRCRCLASDDWLLVYGCPNGLPHPRLGLSVSRKLDATAVARNRWKRLLREAFRLSRQDLPQGIDLVVIPRKNNHPELDVLKQSLTRLAKKIAEKLKLP